MLITVTIPNLIENFNLNTSNVNVNLFMNLRKNIIFLNLNTSNVNVNLSVTWA